MPDEKTVKEKIRELEIEFAESIKEAQSQPGLREMEIVYGNGSDNRGAESELTSVSDTQS